MSVERETYSTSAQFLLLDSAISSSSVHIHALMTLQWNLDLSFFKGMEKTNDECGKTINPGNYYTL